jgi:hypothetical protein
VTRHLWAGIVVLAFSAAAFIPAVSAQSTKGNVGRAPDDPVARLLGRLETGRARLDARLDRRGHLASLMTALAIRDDSQTLVFAKNSLQSALISPRTPRAIYFNDQVYIGFIPQSDTIELIGVDPVDGLMFYTLTTGGPGTPRLERQLTACAGCHGRGDRAALTISSVIPNRDGRPFLAINRTGPVSTDHRTPFERRWGGWYVTGTHGSQRHMGNAVARQPFYPFDLEQEGTQNRATLAGKVDMSTYPAQTSDIVALMTLEHQARMTNLILQTGQRSRAPRTSAIDDEAAKALDAGIEELVAYMLFADEAPLRAPIKGVSTFSVTFPERGPRDTRGRSLRDFDLHTRLFKYPLSYMVYSAEFDAITAPVRTKIYQRLFDVLTGKNTSPSFARLSSADRLAILEIVRDTKPNLPGFWKTAVGGPVPFRSRRARR